MTILVFLCNNENVSPLQISVFLLGQDLLSRFSTCAGCSHSWTAYDFRNVFISFFMCKQVKFLCNTCEILERVVSL